MTSEGYFASAEWGWVGEEFPHGIRLMFVRAVPPERIIEALEADPADARWLTAEVTYETLVQPFARVGRTDDWAFCIDNCFFDVGGFSPAAAQLSTGTELALLDSLESSGYFWYFVDGVEVTSFEPLMSAWRAGTDPDRFVPQMRQAGLDVEPPPDDAPVPPRSPNIALLDMLTLALGIRLSRETATGPLLTVRPGCGGG
jgi:Family of unknown function (DUF6461)